MLYIRQGSTELVPVGPFVDVGDGFTPETAVALSTADEAEAILHNNGTVVDISGYTWAAITGADGWYHLTLQTGISNTVGHVTIVVQDDSVCLPVFAQFTVVEEAVYDALFASSADIHTAAISDIESSLVIVRSDLVISNSDTAAIHSDTTIIASDVVVIASDAAAIHSDTTIIASDVVILDSSITVIQSDTTVIESDSAVIEGGVVIVSGTADSGSTTTMVDAARTEADNDYWNGKWIQFTSGTISGQVREITDFVASTDTITFSPATTQAVSTNTYNIIPGVASSGLSAAQDSKLTRVQSDVILVYSDTTVIASDTAVIEAAGGSLTAAQDSKLTRVQSDIVLVYSDTTAIHSDTTIIASDVVILDSSITVIQSQTTVIESDTTLLESSRGVIDEGTAQSATATTLVLRAAAAFADDELIGATLVITGGSTGVGQSRIINDYASSSDTATVDTWTTTPTGTITYQIFGTADSSALSTSQDSLLTKVSSDVVILDSSITVIQSQTTVIESDTTVIESDTTNLETAVILAEGTADSGTTTTMVDAARTEADADYWTGNRILFTSGTIAGQVREITDFTPGSDTVTFSPATTQAVGTNTYKILQGVTSSGMSAAQDSKLTKVTSDVVILDSSITVIQSDTTVIESDVAQVYSDTTVIASDVVLVYSDTAAIHSDTTVIASDLVIVASDLQQVYSDTTIVVSDTTYLELGVISGATEAGTLSTTQCTTDLSGYADDELIGRVIIFTGGTANGQAAEITDYANSNGLVTYAGGITTAPAAADTFKIV